MRTRAQGMGPPCVACGRWDADGGGRQYWVNKGMRRVGKGNKMGRVAWEGRPHCSTTVVRLCGGSGRRGQRWQGAAAELKWAEWPGKEGLTAVQLW